MSSATHLRHCPEDTGREIAFCGRSNAGKSTAINALTRRTALARTSKTPGRTRAINFFALNPQRSARLVDLPGYGYARVSRSEQQAWERSVDAYLRSRTSLAGLVLMVDIRRLPGAFDLRVLQWCAQVDMRALLLLTKADKLSRSRVANALDSCERMCAESCQVLAFSGVTGLGVETARAVLEEWLQAE